MRAWKHLDEVKKTRIKKKDRYNGDLEKAFLDAYFKPCPECIKQLEVLKKFSVQQAITYGKKIDSKGYKYYSILFI